MSCRCVWRGSRSQKQVSPAQPESSREDQEPNPANPNRNRKTGKGKRLWFTEGRVGAELQPPGSPHLSEGLRADTDHLSVAALIIQKWRKSSFKTFFKPAVCVNYSS